MSNSPSPLDQLHDIALPTTDVSPWTWPLPVGWWITLLAIMITVAMMTYGIDRYRQRAYRRAALKELASASLHNSSQHSLQNSSQSNADYLQICSALLKRCAIHAYGRQQVGKLSGSAWIQLLQTQAPVAMPDTVAAALQSGHYQKKTEIDRAALEQFTQQWINKHYRQLQAPVTQPAPLSDINNQPAAASNKGGSHA